MSRSTNQLIQFNQFIANRQRYDPLTGAYNQYTFTRLIDKNLVIDTRKPRYLISFHIDDTTDAKNYYIKHLSSILMSHFEEGYEYCRTENSLQMFSSETTISHVEQIWQTVQAYLVDFNEKYQANVVVYGLAIQIDFKLDTGIRLFKVIKNHKKPTDYRQIKILSSDSDELTQLFEDEEHLVALKKAISNESIVLYRQKITPLQLEECQELYEVLVRLKKGKQLTGPNKFIPLAEESGDIVELDKLVIKKTLCMLVKEPSFVCCSINLSGKTIVVEELRDYIDQLLKQTNIAPDRITFEITETYAVSNIEKATEFICWARDKGCHFALDDFGKGLSSFSYLQTLPINKVKIDGVFIKDIDVNEKNRLFVKSITQLCHQLELTCVAEFVESEAIRNVLVDLNVDFGQGYGIHKPEEWIL